MRASHKKKGLCRFSFFFLEKRERSFMADGFVLVEKRVGRLPLAHHENYFGSHDPILIGIGLDIILLLL